MLLLNDNLIVMKLVKILKYTLYVLMALYLIMIFLNPFAMYDLLGGFGTEAYTNLLVYDTLIGIAGAIICFHASRILKSFEDKTFSFKTMSHSFQWMAYTLLLGMIAYVILQWYLLESLDESFYIDTIDNLLTAGVLGFFFLAISQIIKKADYYKTQNDLTI